MESTWQYSTVHNSACKVIEEHLVVSPKGIATEWVAEMQTHFNEQFQLVLG